MRHERLWLGIGVLVIGAQGMALSGCGGVLARLGPRKPDLPTEGEKQALGDLDRSIDGAVVWAHEGRIRKLRIGDAAPADLGGGKCARFSPDGRRLAIHDAGTIFIANADGGERVLLFGHVVGGGCPMDFLGNDEVVVSRREGVFVMNIATRALRRVGAPGGIEKADLSASADGRLVLAQGKKRGMALDLGRGREVRLGGAAGIALSPDGGRVLRVTDDRTLAYVQPAKRAMAEAAREAKDDERERGKKREKRDGEGKRKAKHEAKDGDKDGRGGKQAGGDGEKARDRDDEKRADKDGAPDETRHADKRPDKQASKGGKRREPLLALDASVCPPGRGWQHHHWSNHPDYVIAEGGGRGVCVVDVARHRGVRVAWERGSYPDLHVEKVAVAETAAVPAAAAPAAAGETAEPAPPMQDPFAAPAAGAAPPQ